MAKKIYEITLKQGGVLWIRSAFPIIGVENSNVESIEIVGVFPGNLKSVDLIVIGERNENP
uniref:Uncharacterized protein n=1 Tax=viral metagenome TaxID=1070528 RepID=A0A6M3LTA3_9ZZZZ